MCICRGASGSTAEAHRWVRREVTAAKVPVAKWTTHEWLHFLKALPAELDVKRMAELDAALKGMGMRGLKTPVRSPTANAFCERLIGLRHRRNASMTRRGGLRLFNHARGRTHHNARLLAAGAVPSRLEPIDLPHATRS